MIPRSTAARTSRSRRYLWGLAGAIFAALVANRIARTFTGGGADMAHHYDLTFWFTRHWSRPPAHDPALLEMARYPPASHLYAAVLGRILGSAFRGLQLAALSGAAAIWLAITLLLATLTRRRSIVAFLAVATVLALNTARGPLRIDTEGYEIVGNFFFAELVGEVFVWFGIYFVVRRLLAGQSRLAVSIPVAMAAVLVTFVHVLPAVELLVLVGCLCCEEILIRAIAERRRGARAFAAPIALPLLTATGVVLSPGFRSMRALAANNGALTVPYLNTLSSYLGLAALVLLGSIGFLALAVRESNRRDAAVIHGLALGGVATAVPCFAQALALVAGEGSAYAVKKYVFGLLTFLILDACVALALLVRDPDVRQRRGLGTVAVAMTSLALLAVFSHRGSGYSVAHIEQIEDKVSAYASSSPLPAGIGYAGALPSSDPVLDYMFSISILRAPREPAARALLSGQGFIPNAKWVLTATGSTLDDAACERGAARHGLVIVGLGCLQQARRGCEHITTVGTGGLAIDPRLRGFSLAEAGGRWTSATHASFRCLLDHPATRVRVRIDADAFVPPGVPRQRAAVSIGAAERRYVMTAAHPHTVLDVTSHRRASRDVTVNLLLPDAISPSAAGVSVDARRIALFVHEIRVDAG